MTPLASVAMLEKLALLKIALCKAPVFSSASAWRTSPPTSFLSERSRGTLCMGRCRLSECCIACRPSGRRSTNPQAWARTSRADCLGRGQDKTAFYVSITAAELQWGSAGASRGTPAESLFTSACARADVATESSVRRERSKEVEMAKATRAVPEGHHTVTPALTLDNAAEAIEWYKRALGAEEMGRAVGPDGKIMHAELRIGDSRIMLNDAMMGFKGPKAMGGCPGSLWLYVEDCDALFNQAIAAGGQVLKGGMGEM